MEEMNKISESDGPEEENYRPDSCDSDPGQVEDDVDELAKKYQATRKVLCF